MTPEQQIKAAEAAHEANRHYCMSIGDHSQPSWLHAPEWQKESALLGVKFHLSNPASTPQDSHSNWCLDKIRDGWTYGPNKDPEKKTHPCLVPYDQLPLAQRTKDYIFKSVVEHHIQRAKEKA